MTVGDDPTDDKSLVVSRVPDRLKERRLRNQGKGMFANQNTACKLRNQFTLERLVDRFDPEE